MDSMFNEQAFDSSKHNALSFQLATGLIHYTTIVFDVEKMYVRIEAKGDMEFYDAEHRFLDSVTLPEEVDGRGVYEEVNCEVKDNTITLKFPIVAWIDNYPYCDGEYDRWDTRTIGHHTVVFDLQTKSATLV